MRFNSRVLKRILFSLGLALLLARCGVEGGVEVSNNQSLTIGSAEIIIPVDDRRIAIVHSQSSKSNFYDPFAYNQLFAAMQHQAMMAGIPFDLLNEDQLAAANVDLLSYDTILIPQMSHVKNANRQPIVNRLLEAQQNGVGIITSGEFLGSKADGSSFTNFTSAMISVLGIQPTEYFSGVEATVTITDNSHPVTKSYQSNEELQSYEQIWFGSFEPVSGEQSTALNHIKSGGSTYSGAQIIERSGRVVHFANDQIMADNNLLWRVIQWVTYGNVAPVSLQVSRADHVFLARNDMDQAMIASELNQTEIPLLEIISDWKQDYNFVGSYYIDIGNDPANGEYTDWSVSGPLYRDYIDLGNEIATHSWTHPHHTSLLTAAELEFEFKDSAAEIGTNVGTPVIGAAVPGNAESLEVVETLNPWLDYLSGRTGAVGSGYLGATGYLEPQHSMMYFSLNMSPDYTLIDYLNHTPAQATEIWKEEFDGLLKHAQQPLVHWLWHDYGPTTQTDAGLYTKEMFSDTIAYAKSFGAEFATLQDMHQRIKSFAAVDFQVGAAGTVTANVDATDVGQFSLKITDDAKIESVANWYAYSDDRVFLPNDGGEFIVSLTTPNATVTDATRITQLPMRARLISLTGNGNQLNFTFKGEGEVRIVLSEPMTANTSVSGADSFSENGNVLTLRFNSDTTHVVELMPATPLNDAPVATGGSVTTQTTTPVPVLLTGTDANNDTLTYNIETNPQFGTLNGSAPNLTYIANPGYTGTDSFTYTVDDGTVSSNMATIQIAVTAATSLNTRPIANELILETLVDQAYVFQLSGSDQENQALTYRVTNAPANGTLTGTAPNLTYTPNAGFIGTDSLEFVVNDSLIDSAPGTVVFNIDSRIIIGTGTVSNTATDINLDGDLTEWSAMTPFATDPQDITGSNNQIDWRSAIMAHDATDFYIAYTEHGTADLSWGNQIYIDTDSDATTGFRGFGGESPVGADFLVEGDALFRYTGLVVQNNWLWEFVGTLNAMAANDSVEIKIPRTLIDNPQNMLLYFHGNSAATAGTAVDYYPDNAVNASADPRSRQFSYSVNPNNTAGNLVPVAFAQRIRIAEGTTYPLTLTGFDPDGDPLTYIVEITPQAGTITGTAPNLVYTPNANASQDLIAFRVSDGAASSDSRSVQFFIEPTPTANSRPSANNQSLNALTGTAVPVTLSGTDVDGDALTYRIINQPLAGALTGTAPNLSYAAPTTAGTDSFTYVVNDGTTDSNPATVSINISVQNPINTVPQAQSQSVTTNFDTALGINLSASDADNDPLSYTISRQPTSGTLSGTAPQLTYLPFAGASGSDSFQFFVNDGFTNSPNATVAIEVLPAEPTSTAPIANGQSLTTGAAQPLSIVLSGRDTEQSTLNYNVTTQPQGGTLSGTAPNMTYTPDNGFTGVDSFTFSVSDGELTSSNATVSIDVGSAPTGVISNPVNSLTIDGAINDWSGLQSLGIDPADIYGVAANNPLDWREVWVAHSATDLYIAYKNHETFSLSWGHGIYIDTDNNINTGFRGFSGEYPIGADILLEYADVQQYTGSGTNWSWTTVDQSTVATSSEIAEISVSLAALSVPAGNPQHLRFYLRADNSAFSGNTIDHFPDSALDATAGAELRSLVYSLTP